MSYVLPIVGLSACAMAPIGAILTLMSREANLAGSLGIALGDSNPISAFTRISLIVAETLRSNGIYPHELALFCTLVGTPFLTLAVFAETGNGKSKNADVSMLFFTAIACVCVVYVGMPTFSTATHQIVAL